MQLRAVPGAHRAFGPRSAVRHRVCRTPRGRRAQGGRHATARSRSSVSATGPRRNETIRSWSTLRVAPNPDGSASSLKKSSGRMAMTLARNVPRPRSLRLYGNRERHGRRLRFCARGAAAFEASALAECSSADVARSDDWFRRKGKTAARYPNAPNPIVRGGDVVASCFSSCAGVCGSVADTLASARQEERGRSQATGARRGTGRGRRRRPCGCVFRGSRYRCRLLTGRVVPLCGGFAW